MENQKRNPRRVEDVLTPRIAGNRIARGLDPRSKDVLDFDLR